MISLALWNEGYFSINNWEVKNINLKIKSLLESRYIWLMEFFFPGKLPGVGFHLTFKSPYFCHCIFQKSKLSFHHFVKLLCKLLGNLCNKHPSHETEISPCCTDHYVLCRKYKKKMWGFKLSKYEKNWQFFKMKHTSKIHYIACILSHAS